MKKMTYWDVLIQLKNKLYKKTSYWIGVAICIFGLVLILTDTKILVGFIIALIGLVIMLSIKASLMKQQID